MLKKLQLKFIAVTMVLVTAMLCIIFGMVFHFTRQNLAQESVRMMQEIAIDPLQSETQTNSQGDIRLPYFVVQLTQRGDLLLTGSGYYDLTDTGLMLELIAEAAADGGETGILSAYNLRYYRTTIHSSQYLVFADVSSEIRTLNNLKRNSLILGCASFLAFLGISVLLARWAVKPVARAWAQQRQFVADASHELKTPLTVIMTNAELLQSPLYGEPERRNFSENILTMSHQMRDLVTGLLELARVDAGAVHATFAPLDFSTLVSDAVLPFEPVYFEQGLSFESAVEPSLFVNGCAAHLQQTVEVLLDNAQKYSQQDGDVRLTLERRGRHCLLCVSDTGVPISSEDLQNIFKRFYRADHARSTNHSYGLGLSIAASFIKEHHGKIWAESSDGWNRFFVQLPLCNTPQ